MGVEDDGGAAKVVEWCRIALTQCRTAATTGKVRPDEGFAGTMDAQSGAGGSHNDFSFVDEFLLSFGMMDSIYITITGGSGVGGPAGWCTKCLSVPLLGVIRGGAAAGTVHVGKCARLREVPEGLLTCFHFGSLLIDSRDAGRCYQVLVLLLLFLFPYSGVHPTRPKG